MTVYAAADGSALGNPGPAGWAWFIDEQRWAAGGWPHGTNNMGELKAVLDLLEQTSTLAEELHVYCDSKYTIDSITKWMPGWKRKGWKKGDGQPVKNLDLMKALDLAMKGRSVTFEWVKGHAGHTLNEKADMLANRAAAAYQAGSTPEPGPGFGPTAHNQTPPQAFADDTLFNFAEPSDDDVVVEGELQVRGADDADRARLLHPDWVGVVDSELVTQDSWQSDDTEPTFVRIESLSADAKLVVTATDGALQSAVWVRTASGWRRRFSHQ